MRSSLNSTFFGMAGIVAAGPSGYSRAMEISKLEFAEPGGASLTGDLYVPAGATKAPVVVSVHGGGWQVGVSGMHAHWGKYLAEHGIALFSINYRLAAAERKAYPEAVHDVRAAVQFVKSKASEFKIDPERVALMGDS